ncbi:hypothetical protein [Alishewanella sp. HL-SH06]|uniref:hypothetical protein n=1 Tax=Alishewanella sp. HL-SH06 TaxID=3461144 RepID=UPI0040420F82
MASTSNIVSLIHYLNKTRKTFWTTFEKQVKSLLTDHNTSLGFDVSPSLQKKLTKNDYSKDVEDLINRASRNLKIDEYNNTITEDSLQVYIRSLSKQAGIRAIQLDLLEVFIRYVKFHTDVSAPTIPRLVTVKSDMPCLTAVELLRAHYAEKIDQLLTTEMVQTTSVQNYQQGAGRLVLWLMFRLGVIEQALLQHIITAPVEHFVILNPLCYFKHNEKRIFLDTTAQLLLQQVWALQESNDKATNLLKCINAYLTKADPSRQLITTKFTKLKEAAKIHLTLKASPMQARPRRVRIVVRSFFHNS